MIDFTKNGTVAAGKDGLRFGPRRLFSGVTAYTVGFWFRLSRSAEGGVIFSEVNNLLAWAMGFVLNLTGTNTLMVQHDTGQVQTSALTLNTLYNFFVCWDSISGIIIHRDGSNWYSNGTFLTIPGPYPPGVETTIGSDSGQLVKACCGQVGNIAVWPNIKMTSYDAAMWNSGIMPHRGDVRFFYRGINIPGRDEFTRQIPDCYRWDGYINYKQVLPFFDAVSLYDASCDDYYQLCGETMHEGMQAIASEELLRRRLVKKNYQITVPTSFIASEPEDDLQLTHRSGLECTGEGFGYGGAPERLVRVKETSLNPESRSVMLKLLDIKRLAMTYYNSFRSPYTITGRQLGVFQLMPTWLSKRTSRESYSWGKDKGGIYQEFGFNQEPITYNGLLIESKRSNYFYNSAFNKQLAGWTVIDPGAGTVTAESPSVKVFDESITQYACKLVCGPSPAGDYAGVRQEVIGGGVDTDAVLSFIYYAPTAGNFQIRIQRSSDSWYLQTLTGTWGASATILVIPLETSYKNPIRYYMPYIFDGDDSIYYSIDFYSAGIADKIIWLYHTQFEEGKFSSSPIVS